MCNLGTENFKESSSINYGHIMGSEEPSRVKFLCSFGGNILPRPQDGKLRYVGGETRIVSVPREIGYDELMSRMRELYEGASIFKYQQPDEDLDALVSVVNDDDVGNMMEEYDKSGSGDGFTRLRIFLFSQPEHDSSMQYMDGDERDTERRYVDALNSLNESTEYRRQQFSDSPIMTPVDEVHIADQLFNSMNLEGSGHNQRNYEMGMPQYNLRQLAIPSMGSGQHSAPVAPWYNEEAPWSPAYYSPRCAAPHDTRTFTEYPSSPSSARYRLPYQELPDKCVNCMHEEPSHHYQIPLELPRNYPDKMVWLPTGGMPVDRGGFPGNILSGPTGHDGTSVCGRCKMTFQRPSSSEFHRRPGEPPHVEHSTIGNGFPQVATSCVECLPRREAARLNPDPKLHPGIYNQQNDPSPYYNNTQATERGWILQNQVRTDVPRDHLSGTGTNIPVCVSYVPEGHPVPTSYALHEDPRHIRPGVETGEVYLGQAVAAGSHIEVPLEERGVHTTNLPLSYRADTPHTPHTPHQVVPGHPSAQAVWRNVPPVHVRPAYDSSSLQTRIDSPGGVIPPGAVEGGGSNLVVGVDQGHWVESPRRRVGVDGSATPEYPYSHMSKLNHGVVHQEFRPTIAPDALRNQLSTLSTPPESLRMSELPKDNLSPSCAKGYSPAQIDDGSNLEVSLSGRGINSEASDFSNLRKVRHLYVNDFSPSLQNNNGEKISSRAPLSGIDSNSIKSGNKLEDDTHHGETNAFPPDDNADLTFLPELIASAKKAILENAEVVKARAQEDGGAGILRSKSAKVANVDETKSPDINGNSERGSEHEYSDPSKIEPTKAEEEAIARGLQTIRNDDLEEFRQLGSGTYGAVYHGKWKGSDVAIKRIKASCFAGRPSERERLIADFWKEALILSSLHHPNVVSFYGIVRDGPDGSLATVTEFMVNGSLKQYLQKKDRTIDRRKRLIIAMDAAFGMEYLHGKNIVHFDLKCENLLVNMRDPHRPVCKIGDLGLSKVKQHTLVSGGVRGTLPWMAPELLSGKSNMVTEKIDVYSFGIVMWELLTGEEPYSDMHCASIIGGIVNNMLRPQIPTWCDPEWKSLMESCWASDPAERPSFSDISQKLRTMAAAMNVK